MSEELTVSFPPDNDDQWPRILGARRRVSTVELDLAVPSSTHWFTGHFEGQPVLPGVVQVFWAEYLVRELFSVPLGPFQIRNLKFSTMVLPDAELTLTIEHQLEKDQWAFRYCAGKTVYSSGTLTPTALTNSPP